MALPIMEVTAMMNDETRRKLLEMGMQEILDAIDMQNKDIDCTVLGFDERMQMIVDYAYQEKFNQRVKRLIKQAKFRLDGDINSIYYSERGFRREDLHSIASCGFIKENRFCDNSWTYRFGQNIPWLRSWQDGMSTKDQNAIYTHA